MTLAPRAAPIDLRHHATALVVEIGVNAGERADTARAGPRAGAFAIRHRNAFAALDKRQHLASRYQQRLQRLHVFLVLYPPIAGIKSMAFGPEKQMGAPPRRKTPLLGRRLRRHRGGGLPSRLLLRAQVFAGLLIDALHRQLDLAAIIEAQDLDLDLVADLDDVCTLPTRCGASSLIWTRPSRAPRKLTKAPKSTVFTTLPL